MPVIIYDSKDAIPEGLAEGAKEADGKWSVNVVLKTKLDEFRENNVKKSEELEAAQKVLVTLQKVIGEDVTPEDFATKYAEMQSIVQRVSDGELTESGDIEAEVEKRTKQMKASYETQLAESEKRRATAETKASESDKRFKSSQIDSAISAAVMNEESGAEPLALRYIQMEAREVFSVDENGKLVPNKDGATLYGADGVTPMTPIEWVTDAAKNNAMFAKRSGGGGGGGDKAERSGYSDEEWSKLSAREKLAVANGDRK